MTNETAKRMVEVFLKYSEEGLDVFGMDSVDDLDKQLQFEMEFEPLICEVLPHNVIDDHCGKPEHRFCTRCRKLQTEIEG